MKLVGQIESISSCVYCWSLLIMPDSLRDDEASPGAQIIIRVIDCIDTPLLGSQSGKGPQPNSGSFKKMSQMRTW